MESRPVSSDCGICINPNTWSDAEEPSNLLMLQRYEALQIVIKSLVASNLYITWLKGQDKEKKDKGKAIKEIEQNDDHWNAVSLTVRVLNPVVKLLRLTDGKTGATLGKVFGLCAEVAANFKKEIPGLSKEETKMIQQLFSARWLYLGYTATPMCLQLQCSWTPSLLLISIPQKRKASFVRSYHR